VQHQKSVGKGVLEYTDERLGIASGQHRWEVAELACLPIKRVRCSNASTHPRTWQYPSGVTECPTIEGWKLPVRSRNALLYDGRESLHQR
jgi:hypothetical protein